MSGFKNRFKIVFISFLLTVVFFIEHAYAQRAPLTLIRDTEIETTLHAWGMPVFKAAGLDPAAVNIILVQSDQVNAFVAGGSNIFFYTGLISKTETPGELIGVLAHETGHIAGGHLIRAREALERASYESIIGTLLGVGAAIASGDPNAAAAVSLGSTSIAQRTFLAHSRVHESSADQAALTFLERAKINPDGLVSFMDKLKAETYVPEDQQSEYVRTHPLVDNRVEALKTRVSESAYTGQGYPKAWNAQHQRMKAKLIGFIHPEQIQWVYDDKDVSVPAQYARAIGAYRQNRIEEALKRIDDLLQQEPKNPYFFELKGQMLVEFGRVEEAVPYYERAVSILPESSLFRIALAHALIEGAGQSGQESLKEAIDHLERALQDEPRSSRVHRLLATAYGRVGKANRAKLHLAEEAVLQRRFPYAKQHAQAIINAEEEGSSLWIKAKDIISFIETMKKG
ncbi:MAG: M48 family metalloprotease [Alphaproteobacteria bacterium]